MGESRPDRASVPQDVRPVYFEDFEAGRVYDLGSITVRENDIVAFARQFDRCRFTWILRLPRRAPSGD
jgi:acyl dehydratase